MKDLKVKNVKEMVFLEGYFEPTLLLLFEPKRIWSGRALDVTMNSCSICAVSLNITQKRYPTTVWSSHLPFDSRFLVAVPQPISGVLVFSCNYIFYFNQTTKYCFGLNTDSLKIPPMPQVETQQGLGNIVIQKVECSLLSVSENEITYLMSIQTGDIYYLNLMLDGRSVCKIHLTRALSSVPTSSICHLGQNLFFLGSKLGNSLLISYKLKKNAELIESKDSQNKTSKSNPRIKIEFNTFEQRLDDLFSESEESKRSRLINEKINGKIAIYDFRLEDELINIGKDCQKKKMLIFTFNQKKKN